jgi:hypothetical protein
VSVRALLLLACAPIAVAAQVRPATPDTTRRDTVQFSGADSVMAVLLQKPGYTITRYEGGMVTFDAAAKAFAIAAASANRAIVEREGQRVVTDSGGSIVYNDQNRGVSVTGNFRIVPGAGQPDIAGTGTATYNLAVRSGIVTIA